MRRAVATHLMFEGAAKTAMKFYVSLFSGSEIKQIERYGLCELTGRRRQRQASEQSYMQTAAR
jgi:predicted 3-demethylubiquinone-9 3-methyltransferase (glyoxalase superfamily)